MNWYKGYKLLVVHVNPIPILKAHGISKKSPSNDELKLSN